MQINVLRNLREQDMNKIDFVDLKFEYFEFTVTHCVCVYFIKKSLGSGCGLILLIF